MDYYSHRASGSPNLKPGLFLLPIVARVLKSRGKLGGWVSPFEALGPSIVATFHDISYDSTDHGRELEAMPAPTTGYDESFPIWILVDQEVAIKRIAVHAHALFNYRCLC